MILLGIEENIDCVIYVLKTFCLDLSIILNWIKLSEHWKNPQIIIGLLHNNKMAIIWTNKENVSKLFRVLFRLLLAFANFDSFL